MSKVKMIQAYKCSDGKVFTNATDAHNHENDVILKKELTRIVESFFFRGIDSDEVVKELIEHFDEIKEALA